MKHLNNKIYWLLIVLIAANINFSKLRAQSCNGYPTGNVFPGNIMNYTPECSPVTASWYVEYSKVDDGGNSNNVAFEFIWGDGVTEIIPYSSGLFTYVAASRKYSITKTHKYPNTTTVCEYDPIVYLRIAGNRCTSTQQTQPVYMWDKDNAGSGVLLLEEQSKGVVLYQICEGVDATLTFVDNSTFNCNISASPDNPNQQDRWIQFQYGTTNNATYAATAKIPNVTVGGTPVTNASGTATILNGTVVQIPLAALSSGKTTLPVVIDGNSTVGKVGTVFEITLRNWNYCNKYDDGVAPAPGVNGDNAPVITTAIIQVIDAPLAPIAPSKSICSGGNRTLTATSNGGTGGTMKWYSNSSLTSLVNTGNTYIPTSTAAGIYDFWVTETLGTTNCEGPATKVTLTIREALSYTGTLSGPTAVCQQSTGNVYSSSVAPPTNAVGGTTKYVWSTTGDWTGTSSTSTSQTYTIGSSTGAKVLTSTLQYTTTVSDGTSCGVSKTYNVTVNPLPGATISADSSNKPAPIANYCSNGTVKVRFSSITGIGTGSFTIKYTNGTTTWTQSGIPLTGGAYSPGTQPAANTTTNYTITQIVENTTNGCTTNSPNTLIVNNCKVLKRAALSTPGTINGTSPVCASDINLQYTTSATQFTTPPTVGGATRFRWQITTANGWKFADNTTTDHLDASNATMEFNSGTGSGTFQARLEYTTAITGNSSNFCVSSARSKTVTVTSRPTVSISTNTPTICTGTKPSLTFTISGGLSPYTVVYSDGSSNFTIANISTSPYTFTHANNLTANKTFSLVSITSQTAPNCSGTLVSPTSASVTVLALPTASISCPVTSICSGSSTAINVTSTGSSPFDVVLNDGTSNINLNSISTSYSYSVSPTVATTYNLVSIQLTNSPGCVGTVSPTTVSIGVNTPPSTANAGVDQAFCSPTVSATLNATAPTVGTGTWSYIGSDPVGRPAPTINNTALRNSGVSIVSPNWGDYTFRWTVSNGALCPASTDDVIISFGAAPDIPDAGNDTSVCFPTYTLKGKPTSISVGTGTWTATGPGTVTFSNNHSQTSTATASTTGLYKLYWTISSGACTPKKDSVNITFQPLPATNAGSDNEICTSQDSVTLSGSATNYQNPFWSGGTGGFSNINSLTPKYKPTSAERTSGQVKLYLNVNGQNSCATKTAKDSMIITINSLPVISAGSNVNFCGTSTTLAGTKTLGTGTWSKLSGPGTVTFGNVNSGSSTVSVSSYGTYLFIWTVTNNQCSVKDTVTYGFFENPASSSPGSDISVCGLSTTLAGTAHTYTSSPTGNTKTWAKVSGPGTITFGNSSSPTSAVTASTYGAYVLSWTEANGPCSKTGNITLNFYQAPSINITPSPAVVCEGSSLALDGGATLNSGSSFTSHTWTGNTAILSATNIKNPNVLNSVAPGIYNLTYTATDNNTCNTAGNVTVTVNALATINSQPSNTSVCALNPASFTVSATGTGLSHQWQVWNGSSYSDLSNDATYSGVTSATLSIPSAATGLSGKKYRCKLTTSSSCVKFSNDATLTVNALANISVQPSDKAICENSNTSFGITATGSGLSYKWQVSGNNGATWNNLADTSVYSGSATATLVLSSLPTSYNNLQYHVILTTTGSCTVTSNAAKLTVNANPVITSQPTDKEVCEDNSRNISLTASNPSVTYKWQSKANGSFADITDNAVYQNSSTNTLSITGADLSYDNVIYRCRLTTPGNCTLYSNSALLDVTPKPTVYAGDSDEVCSSNSIYNIQAISGATASNYSSLTWSSSSTGTFSNSHTLYPTYNINATDRSNKSVTLTLTVIGNGSCTQSVSSTKTLTVTPAVVVSAGTDQETCEDIPFDLTNSSIKPSASNFSSLTWSKTGTGSFSNNNIILPTYIPSSGETGDISLTIVATGNGSCASVQDVMILNITPKPTVNAGTDEATCSDAAFDLIGSVSKPTASEYKGLKWTYTSTTTSPSPWTTKDTILYPTFKPRSADAGKTVKLTLTATGNGSCSSVADDMILTVKTKPVTSAITGAKDLCINTSQVYKVTNTVLSTYSWGILPVSANVDVTPFNNIAILDFNNNPYKGKIFIVETKNGCNGDTVFLAIQSYSSPIVDAGNDLTFCAGKSDTIGSQPTASGGSGSYTYSWSPSLGLNNASIANPIATPTVSTQYTVLVADSKSGCPTVSNSINITVNPIPAAPNAVNKSACYQSTVPSLEASGSNIKWYSNSNLSTLVFSGSPFNTGKTSIGKYAYYVTQTVNGCTSAATVDTLTINSVPSAPATFSKTGCVGQTIPALKATGTNIKWYSDVALQNLVYGDSVYNTGKSQAGTYNYFVTQTINNCQSIATGASLTIYTPPSAPVATDTTVCEGQTIPLLKATGVSGSQFKWYSDIALLVQVGSGSSFNTNKTAAGSYYYYVAQTLNGCQSASKTVNLTINPSPVITSTINTPQSVCNSSDASITINATGTAPLTYSINGGITYFASGIFTSLSQGIYPLRVKNGYNCIISPSTITIALGNIPSPPSVQQPSPYCKGNTLNQIIATGNVNGTLKWYSDPNLSNLLAISDRITPYDSVGTKVYYATETKDTCESLPAPDTVTIYPIPVAPGVTNKTICLGSSTTLTATGSNITWYSNSSLTNVVKSGSNTYTPPIIVAGTYNYWVTQTINGCRGPAAMVTLKVKGISATPLASDAAACTGNTIPNLQATGTAIKWYNDATATFSLAFNGSPFPTGKTAAGSYVYYVTQDSNGCRSQAKKVTLTIGQTPSVPVANNAQACEGDTLMSLTTTGTNVKWYSDSLLSGAPVSTSNTYVINNLGNVGSTSFWVTQTSGSCTSLPDKATLTIYKKPDPPTVSDTSSCFGATTPNLKAFGESGAIFKWYSGPTLKYTGNPFTTGNTAVKSYSYQVIQIVNGCSSDASDIKLTINPNPVYSSYTSTNETYCNKKDGTIKITASATNPELPLEYSINNGVSYQQVSSFTNLAKGTYPIRVLNSFGCSVAGASVNILPGGPPPKPVTNGGGVFCDNHTSHFITANANPSTLGSLTWYSDPLLSDSIGSGSSIKAKDTLGTRNYYVTEKYGGCESPSSVVTITINAIPQKPKVTDTAICSGSPLPQLTSTGQTVKWYKSSTLTTANLLASATNIYTPTDPIYSSGQHNIFVTQTVNGCQSSPDTATITVNPIPASPVANDVTICYGPTSTVLTATGQNIKWYSNSALVSVIGTGNNYTSNKSLVGTYKYYITQTVLNCTSKPDSNILTINAIPPAPVGSNVAICEGVSTPDLTVSGTTGIVKWYYPTPADSVGWGNNYTTNQTNTGTYVYYATQTVLGCQSPAAKDTLTIIAQPVSPIVKDTGACNGSTVPNLNAVGTALKWYADTTMTTWLQNGNPYITNKNLTTGNYPYFVTQTLGGCESKPIRITLHIYGLPTIFSINKTNEKYCNTKDGTITVLATDPTPWPLSYSIDNGTSYQASNTFSGLINGTYNVAVKNSKGCLKDNNPVTINPGSNPPAPTVSPNKNYCLGDAVSVMTASGVTGGQLKWYSNAGLTNLIATNTTSFLPSSTLGVKNYYIVDSIGSCISPSSIIQIIVNDLPTATATGSAEICNDGSTAVVGFTFTGPAPYNINFTDGSNIFNISTSNNPEHITTSAQGSYHVTKITDGNGCNGNSFGDTAIITLNPLPTITLNGSSEICNDGVTTAPIGFTLTGKMPFDFKYSIGGDTLRVDNVNATSYILNTMRAGTYVAVAVTDANGCSGTDFGDPASLLLNPLPTGTLSGSTTLCNDSSTNAPITVSLTGEAPWNIDYTLNGITNQINSIGGSPYTLNTLMAGTYKIAAITDNHGCMATDLGASVTINRNALPTASITATDSICLGDSAALIFDLTGQAPWRLRYSINNINQPFDTVYASPFLVYTIPGSSGNFTYKLSQLTDGNGCGAKVFPSKQITVNPLPSNITTDTTSIKLCNSNDGEIVIHASLINTPLLYSVSDINHFVINDTFKNLGIGNYPILVKNKFGCIAQGTPIEMKAGNTPLKPTLLADHEWCNNQIMDSLQAISNNGAALTKKIIWYFTPNLSVVYKTNTSKVYPRSDTLGSVIYYATETVTTASDTCESLPEKVTITRYDVPSAPITTDTAICYNGSAANNPLLLSSGSNVQWYANADKSGGSLLSGSSIKPSSIIAGSYPYYATQTINGCESNVDTAMFTIKPLPVAPLVSDLDLCFGETVPDLHADTSNIRWYSDILAKNFLDSGKNFTTNKILAGSYTYYATQTKLECEGSPASVNLTIKNRPNVPFAKDVIVCEGSVVPALTASGSNIQWYDKDTVYTASGNIFDHQLTDTSAAGTYVYYVTQTVNGCESDFRKVTVTIKPKPVPLIISQPSYCKGTGTPLLIAQGTVGANIVWYQGFTNTILQNSQSNTYNSGDIDVGIHVYSSVQQINGCESDRSYSSVTILSIPSIDALDKTDETYCGKADGSIQITASDNKPLFYSIDSGLNFVLNKSLYSNLNNGNYQVVVKNSDGCLAYGPNVEIKAGGPPPAPVAGKDTVYCFGPTPKKLFASSSAGGTLKWYSNVSLNTQIGTGTSKTPTNAVGTNDYFVTETVGGCQSPATKISITINPIPPVPLVSDTSICDGSKVPSLIAKASYTVKWYSHPSLADTSFVTIGKTLNTGKTTVGNYKFYVIQTSDKNCSSRSDTVNFNIYAIPPQPADSIIVTCSGNAIAPLEVNGSNIRWYTNVSKDQLVATGNIFNTGKDTAGRTYTYIATQTVNGCESDVSLQRLTINQTPESPATENKQICQGDLIPTLLAEGENINWYSSSNLLLASNKLAYTPTIPSVTSVNKYYVTQTTNGCESKPDSALINIYPIPLPPIAQDTQACYGEPTPNLFATGQNIRWYIDANQNIKVGDTSSYATGKTSKGIYNYYVTQTINNCQSSAVNVVLTINNIPRFIKSTLTHEKYCGTKDGTITINALGSGILEYSIDNGVTYYQNNGIFKNLKNGTYFLKVRNSSGCEILGDTVEILAGSAPPAPSAGPEAEYCLGAVIDSIGVLLRASDLSTITWYSDQALTDTLSHQLNIMPLNKTGITSYYVTETLNGCTSPAAKVNISIFPKPIQPNAASIAVCENLIIPDLTAEGFNIQWYTDKTLKVLSFSGNKFSTGLTAPGTYTYYVTQTQNGCESKDSTITLTIYQKPGITLDATSIEGCPPLKTTLKANISNTDIMSWYVNNNKLPLNDTTTVLDSLFQNSNEFTRYLRVKAVAMTNNGCFEEAIKDITIYPNPDYSFIAAPEEACYPAHFQFIAERGGVQYRWYFGKNDSVYGSSVETHDYPFNPIQDTTITVTLIGTSETYYCNDTTSRDITIFPGIKSNFAVSKTDFCAPDTISFTKLTTNATLWNWIFGDGNSDPVTANPSHIYINPGLTTNLIPVELYVESVNGCSDVKSVIISAKPEVNPSFIADTIGCSPFTVEFTNSTPGYSYKYLWRFGDKTQNSASISPPHVYKNLNQTDTTYTVTMVASKDGCIDSTSKNILVHPNLVAGFSVDTNQVCEPFKINITDESQGAYTSSYFWSFGDGIDTNINSPTLSHIYNTSPDKRNYYKLYLKVSNTKCSDSMSRVIIVNPRIKADFILDANACSPFQTQIIDNSIGTGSRTYIWDFGDSTVNAAPSPVYNFVNNSDTNKTFKITQLITSEYNCSDDTTKTITIYPKPVANFKTFPRLQFFPEATYNFTNLTGKGPWQYKWDFGDKDTIASDSAVSHTYSHWAKKDNDYKISVKLIAYTNNCNDTAFDELFLFAPKPIASFDSLTSACPPIEVNFINTSEWGEAYEWDFGDGTTDTVRNPATHIYQKSGEYVVKLTVTAEGGKDITSHNLQVYEKPEIEFNVEPTTVTVPEDIIKCFNNTKYGARYLWDFGDGTTSVEWSPSHTYMADGKYYISLIAWSDYDCTDTLVNDSVVTATVKGKVSYPNAFFPNLSGPGGSSGSQNINSVFRPHSEGVTEYHLEIYNRWGERLFISNSINSGWDGYFKGKLCDQDVYVYKAWGKYLNGHTFTKAGDITLLHRKK